MVGDDDGELDFDDEVEWDEQTLRDNGYVIFDDIAEPAALAQLHDLLAGSCQLPGLSERALKVATGEVTSLADEALAPERRALKARNRQKEFVRGDQGASIVDDLAQVAGQLVVEFRAERRFGGDYVAVACSDMLENTTTTVEAIALLLAHGFAADANARWRGLHELACQAALMARAVRPAEAAKRYLVHGRRLLPDDPAYGEAWATPEFFAAHSEWLRDSYPNRSIKKGKPLDFTQRWIFDTAALGSADFATWIQPSHNPVHMTSAAVAEGSEQVGGAPAGYTPYRSKLVGWQVACSLNEMVASLCQLMVGAGLPAARATAWAESVHRLVRERRPGPTYSPDT